MTGPRWIGSGRRPGPIFVLAVIVGAGIPIDSVPSSFSSGGPTELSRALPRHDFVVEGTVGRSYREGQGAIPIDVHRVLLGTVPDRRLVVRARLKRMLLPWGGTRGARVIAWGGWGDADDTCAVGSVMRVREDGSLWDGKSGLVEGRPISDPGTIDRLRAALDQNWFLNGPEALGGGRGVVVAVVRDARSMPGAVNLMIDSVRAVVGDTLGMPRIVRFAVVCGDEPRTGDRVLLPNPAERVEILDIDACFQQLRIRERYGPPRLFGVAVDDLHFLFGRVGDGYELTREHYAPLVQPSGALRSSR